MDKKKVVEEIYKNKIVAIFRGIDQQKAVRTANALCAGGVRLMEVTFDQTEKETEYRSTVDSIRMISEQADPEILVGAGTVITTEQVVLAYNAGARFIITPTTDPEIIALAGSLGMATMPGAYTPTEINNAYKAGADFVKIFPASEAGPAYFKAVRGPLSHIPLTAVGGVTIENAKSFLDAGAVGLGIGGNLVSKALISNDDYEGLTKLAQEFVKCIS